MRSSTIPERGRHIYDWFNHPDRIGKRFTREEWLAGTRLPNSATTEKALKYARTIAADNGQMIPYAEDLNGNTYILTEDVTEVFDAALATGAMAHGMKVLNNSHLDFAAAKNYAGLTPAQRAVAEARHTRESARRAMDEADAMADAAILAWIRESKHNGVS